MKQFITFIMAVAVIAAAIYYVFDPSVEGNLFPRCVFRTFTVWKCPGCGSQRALHALLHGDIADAWRYNVFMVLVIPIIVFYAFAEFTRTRFPRFYYFTGHPAIVWSLLGLIVLWWVLRNVFEW